MGKTVYQSQEREKDKIVVYNPNYHAIAFEVGDGKTYILPAYLGIEIDFPLSNYSVENTTFTSFYNYDCFRRDSINVNYILIKH